jgi:hypothetical protein
LDEKIMALLALLFCVQAATAATVDEQREEL